MLHRKYSRQCSGSSALANLLEEVIRCVFRLLALFHQLTPASSSLSMYEIIALTSACCSALEQCAWARNQDLLPLTHHPSANLYEWLLSIERRSPNTGRGTNIEVRVVLVFISQSFLSSSVVFEGAVLGMIPAFTLFSKPDSKKTIVGSI